MLVGGSEGEGLAEVREGMGDVVGVLVVGGTGVDFVVVGISDVEGGLSVVVVVFMVVLEDEEGFAGGFEELDITVMLEVGGSVAVCVVCGVNMVLFVDEVLVVGEIDGNLVMVVVFHRVEIEILVVVLVVVVVFDFVTVSGVCVVCIVVEVQGGGFGVVESDERVHEELVIDLLVGGGHGIVVFELFV